MNLNLRSVATDKITVSDLYRLYRDEEAGIYDEPFLDDLLIKLKLGFEDARAALEDRINTYQQETETEISTTERVYYPTEIQAEENALADALYRINLVLNGFPRVAQWPAWSKSGSINAMLGHLHYNMRTIAREGVHPSFKFWDHVLSGSEEELLSLLDSTHEVRNERWETAWRRRKEEGFTGNSSLNLRRTSQDYLDEQEALANGINRYLPVMEEALRSEGIPVQEIIPAEIDTDAAIVILENETYHLGIQVVRTNSVALYLWDYRVGKYGVMKYIKDGVFDDMIPEIKEILPRLEAEEYYLGYTPELPEVEGNES